MDCGHRYSTTEQILRENLYVSKRDGRREEFDKAKIINSLRRACQKRPVDAEQVNILVEDMIDQLENDYGMEIPSNAIGDKVLENLEPLPWVQT